MSWFSPKCPYCGNPLEETGWATPYPSYRCNTCIAVNTAKREAANLKRRVEELEKLVLTK